jgi:C4-dicarboxylate transporter DctM subunit
MDPVTVGLIGFVVLFALLAVGMPISAAMGLVGFLGLWYNISGQAAMIKAALVPFQVVSDYSLAVLPLFLLMAHVFFVTDMGQDLFKMANKWLGHRPGGVAQASVVACAGFSAVSASSMATAATMGLVALPEMKRLNYSPALSTGALAAGGTMGVLIPPSGALIIYGILTGTSIGRLFAAGIIPGILQALFYMVLITLLCRWRPSMGPRSEKAPIGERIRSLAGAGEVIILAIFVFAGIILGWFTPTEGGSMGAFGAILLATIRRRLTLRKLWKACLDTLKTSGMIYAILIGAFMFNYFLASTTIPNVIGDWVAGLPLPPLGILLMVLLVYMVLGCFLDVAAMTVLTIPIFFPLITGLGYDAVWFGIIFVRLAEIAMITPPVGMNVYVISGIAPDVPMETIFKGIVPFVLADVLHVALLIAVPALVLFLPGLMS